MTGARRGYDVRPTSSAPGGRPPDPVARQIDVERWQSPVDCSCLESSRPFTRPGGSNPSRSVDIAEGGRETGKYGRFLARPVAGGGTADDREATYARFVRAFVAVPKTLSQNGALTPNPRSWSWKW